MNVGVREYCRLFTGRALSAWFGIIGLPVLALQKLRESKRNSQTAAARRSQQHHGMGKPSARCKSGKNRFRPGLTNNIPEKHKKSLEFIRKLNLESDYCYSYSTLLPLRRLLRKLNQNANIR
jgi:hypothetical protein